MKNVYTLKCTQLAPEYKENKEIIEYEDTLEKYESVTWKRYAETAAKDLVPKEGLSDEKYAGICRCFEEKLYVIVYRTAVLLKKHPEKLCLTCRIETDIFNFAKIVFSEMLAAKIPAMCGA